MTDGNAESGVGVLEERHMMAIMMYLGENDGCKKTDLYREVSSNPRMPEKLDRLESCGLIRQELTKGSRATRIFLTEPGSMISTELRKIDRMMPNQ